MKAYTSFFRLRFNEGIQYRVAALAGILTQMAFGGMFVLLYTAFYRSDPAAYPMGLQQTMSYLWLRQAFLALFMPWRFDNTIFADITGGNIAYELARPLDIYHMWFAKNLAMRASAVALRFLPVLVLAALIPAPYGLAAPAGVGALAGFLVTMVLGALVLIAMLMIVYALTFFTMQPMGLRMVFLVVADFCAGDLVLLPFFPDGLRRVLELTPFAATSNVPFRIYSGHLAGGEALRAAGLQVFWLLALVGLGRLLMHSALRRTVVQGG